MPDLCRHGHHWKRRNDGAVFEYLLRNDDIELIQFLADFCLMIDGLKLGLNVFADALHNLGGVIHNHGSMRLSQFGTERLGHQIRHLVTHPE